MLLSDPPPSPGDVHFTLFGIPVRIHPWFWLVTALLGARGSVTLASLLLWVAAVLLAILVHELGHAAAMLLYGLRPWITLYGMGGLTSYNPGLNADRRRLGPAGQVFIAFAGPLAGFLLAAGLAAAIIAAGYREHLHLVPVWRLPILPYLDTWNFTRMVEEPSHLADLCNHLFFISVFWGLVNLLPIYPLDGGHIVQEILLVANPRDGMRQALILSVLTAGLIAGMGFIEWQSWFIALFFGYLAYSSYMLLQGGRY